MKRKFLTTLLLAIICLCSVCAFVACDDSEDSANQLQTHTVSFECDFMEIPSQTIKHGCRASKPEITLDNIVFEGCYFSGEKWSFIDDVVIEDITLYVNLYTFGLTFKEKDSLYLVDGYNGETTKVIIPEFFDGRVLASIEGLRVADLENIIISSRIINISFYESVSSVSGKLTSITVDEDNKYYSSQDGVLFNKDKTELIHYPQGKIATSYKIPSSVESIGSGAFSGCYNLTSITVDENNLNYSSQDGILYNKDKTQIIATPKGISGSIVLPNSLTSIGLLAFENCKNLESITIPNSVTSIGNSAFQNCRSLTSVVFENTVGWTVGSISIDSSDLANTTTAADYLTYKYCNWSWTRSDN